VIQDNPERQPLIGCEEGILSEDQLQSKLNIEGFTRADAGSTKGVADGVDGLTESILCVRSCETGGKRWRKVYSIEQVENLRTELHGEPFINLEVLKYSKVYVAVTRGVPFVSRDVAVGSDQSQAHFTTCPADGDKLKCKLLINPLK